MHKTAGRLMSIRTVLIVVFSLLTSGVILVMGIFVNQITTRQFMQIASDYNEQLTSQAKSNLDTYFGGIDEALMRFVRNGELLQVLAGELDDDPYAKLTARKNIVASITNFRLTQNSIRTLFVFYDDDVIMNTDIAPELRMQDAVLQTLLQSYKNAPYSNIQYHPAQHITFYGDRPLVPEILITLPVRNYSRYDTTNYGLVVAILRTDYLNELFEAMQASNGFTAFIVDKQSNIFYSSDPAAVGQRLEAYPMTSCLTVGESEAYSADKRYLVSSRRLQTNDWQLLVLSDAAALQQKISRINSLIITVTLVAITCVVALSFLVALKVTQPLVAMADEMHRVGQDRLGVQLHNSHLYREVSSLYDSYNQMQERIESLIHDVYYEQLRQKDAQYEALQSKINPHFLYNTLQTIHSLSVLERNADVEDVTTSLGDMLEYLVYEKSGQVYFSQEMDYIRSYIKIQQLRFNDSFAVRYRIEPASQACVISKLLIQPLVENAINHGFAEQEQAGELIISAWVEQEVFHVVVSDNGKGMGVETLAALRERLGSQQHDSRKKSIGLTNIQERIVLKYGTDYGLTVESRPGAGTQVSLTMPYVRGKTKEDAP